MTKQVETEAVVGAWTSGPEDAVRFARGEIRLGGLLYAENDMTEYGWCKVGVARLELLEAVPEADAVVKAVDALQAKKAEIYAEAEKAAMKIEQRIGRLLAIEGPKAEVGGSKVIDADDGIPF